MMMSDDKKKQATVIIAKMKEGKKPSMEQAPTNEAGDMEDNSIAVDSAVEELIAAIHSKDAPAVKEALMSFMDLCESPESEEE
jgi:hypothetical protein